MQTKVTPGQIVVMAAGGVALIASFLPFYSEDFGPVSFDPSAWGGGVFPVGTLIMLFALAAAVLVAITAFANVQVGDVLGFGLNQLLLALSFFAAILALAFLVLDYGGDFGITSIGKGIGYWLLLLASIASLVGSILMTTERTTAGPGPGPTI